MKIVQVRRGPSTSASGVDPSFQTIKTSADDSVKASAENPQSNTCKRFARFEALLAALGFIAPPTAVAVVVAAAVAAALLESMIELSISVELAAAGGFRGGIRIVFDVDAVEGSEAVVVRAWLGVFLDWLRVPVVGSEREVVRGIVNVGGG